MCYRFCYSEPTLYSRIPHLLQAYFLLSFFVHLSLLASYPLAFHFFSLHLRPATTVTTFFCSLHFHNAVPPLPSPVSNTAPSQYYTWEILAFPTLRPPNRPSPPDGHHSQPPVASMRQTIPVSHTPERPNRIPSQTLITANLVLPSLFPSPPHTASISFTSLFPNIPQSNLRCRSRFPFVTSQRRRCWLPLP